MVNGRTDLPLMEIVASTTFIREVPISDFISHSHVLRPKQRRSGN